MASSKPIADPFLLPRRSSLLDKVTSPSSVGLLTSAALVASQKLGRNPIPLSLLPRNLTKLPPSVWLVVIGFPAGYLAGKSAGWLRWKIVQRLMAYQGWVDSPRSMKTMAWGILMKMFKGEPTNTYTYQRCLPKQPLPDLNHTLDLWLDVSSLVVSKEEFEQTKDAVERLRRNEGPKLQSYLQERYNTTVNWLSEYWLTAAYLSSRDPLPVYSNFCLVNKRPDDMVTDQLARCSTTILTALLFNELIETKRLAPVQLQDMVPICMNGYRYIFNSLRLPGENIDSLKRYPGETHIVVLRKGHYYRVESNIAEGGKKRLLRPEEIKLQLERICEHADKLPEELPVAALTTMNRTKWAKLREKVDETNRETLNAIESSLFLMTLEHETPKDIHEHAKIALIGRGSDRWFDKGFNAVIWPDAVFGATVEHSGIDAMVMCSVAEKLMVSEEFENGDVPRTKEGPSPALPQPQLLSWKLDHLKDEITAAYNDYIGWSSKVDFYVLNTAYGKGFMKKCKLSPDGYVQMALQLAYYKLHQETTKTYEPSTGRLYALGRTENIHPMSSMSKAWVRSMSDKSCTRQSRQDMLRRAISVQNKARLRATVGQGCDRHLLGLYCASRELQMDVPALFMDKAWRAPFKLSTSQTPTRTAEMGADVEFKWVVGGFGPSCQDGYGVSYIHMGDDLLNICVTSWDECESTTSAKKYAAALEESLEDMKALFV